MGGVAADWLSQLAPPHAPPPPGWWPLAPGWWLLLAFALVAAVTVYRYTRPFASMRRLALRELKKMQQANNDDIALASALQHLLRRYALARFGRDAVAGLSGEGWLAFVVEHGGAAWSGEHGASLLKAAYGGAATASRAAWLSGAESFIRGKP